MGLRRLLLTVVLTLSVVIIGNAEVRADCGDLDGDSNINLSDLLYFINWLIQDGPPPLVMDDANVDLCPGTDISDVVFLTEYLFQGGPQPCSQAGICTPETYGAVYIDSIVGQRSPGVLRTGDTVVFYFRYANPSVDTVSGISSGFRLYSPDGATWDQTIVDTLPNLNALWWGPQVWRVWDGPNDDTAAVLAAGFLPDEGLPPGFDDYLFRISVGPFGPDDVDKTIVVDSCFYGPDGKWKWAIDWQRHTVPSWGGPYTFSIQEPGPLEYVVSPDTLSFIVYLGSAWGKSDYFDVTEAEGRQIEYMCGYIDSGSFIDIPNPNGTTPGRVWVNVDPGYLGPGNYQNIIFVDGPAENAPVEVVVNLEIRAVDTAAMILDHVTGHYGATGFKAGVPVTLHMRAINNTGEPLTLIDNGYGLTSPDGAQWDTVTAEWDPAMADYFDGERFVLPYSTDGISADTIGLAGISFVEPHLPDGFNDIPYTITLGPIDPIHDGKTICLDSCFYPPGGSSRWIWIGDPNYYIPQWSGPHCFHIHSVTDNLTVMPDSLYFEAEQHGSNPVPQAFFVDDTEGRGIVYTLSEDTDWFSLNKAGGRTPDSVIVNVDISGLEPGYHYGFVTINALEAANVPITYTIGLWLTETTIGADSLIVPSVIVDEVCGAIQPVAVKLSQPIKGASIPIDFPPDVVITGLSFDGLVTETWDYTFTEINEQEGYAFVALANSVGQTIPPGTTTIFNMTFNAGSAACLEESYMWWDTTLMGHPSKGLLFADTANRDLNPGFNAYRDSTRVPGYLPGDFSGDSTVNVIDLTSTAAFLFQYGPDPCVMEALDVNSSCTGPNIADLTYEIDYLFQTGAAPTCGCLGMPTPKATTHPGIVISTSFKDGATSLILTTAVDLRGVELQLEGPSGTDVINTLGEPFEVIYGEQDGRLRVGILDLEGSAVIGAGELHLMTISGDFELMSALASDIDHHDIPVTTVGKPVDLPATYALNQNYPNPFNPVTTIRFSVGQNTNYALTIYNIAGQQVAIFTGIAEEGVNEVTWDASMHASGMYLYKLEAGSFTASRKMMLLK